MLSKYYNMFSINIMILVWLKKHTRNYSNNSRIKALYHVIFFMGGNGDNHCSWWSWWGWCWGRIRGLHTHCITYCSQLLNLARVNMLETCTNKDCGAEVEVVKEDVASAVYLIWAWYFALYDSIVSGTILF